jgi:hypothetical protein
MTTKLAVPETVPPLKASRLGWKLVGRYDPKKSAREGVLRFHWKLVRPKNRSHAKKSRETETAAA